MGSKTNRAKAGLKRIALLAAGHRAEVAAQHSDSTVRRAVENRFSSLAAKISVATGSFWAFATALSVVGVWAVLGPVFHYSQTWQLVINTGTTIITFLMVFVIQHAQNRDILSLQLKLNELIAAVDGASNRLIDIEDLDERELNALHVRYQKLAQRSSQTRGAKTSVDIEDPDEDAAPDDRR